MPKKRNDGRYEVKVRVSRPGEPRRYKAVYGSTLREAREKQKAIEKEVQAGIDYLSSPTVSALADYYIAMRSPSLRPQTIRNYQFAIAHITDIIGDRQARSVSVDDARKAISKISEDISPYQGMRSRKILGMVWDDAISRSVLSSNPWRAVPVPQCKTAEKRYLTKGELQALEDAHLTPYDRTIVMVLRYTGMRIGEAVALQRKDIDFKRKLISVSKTSVDGVIFPTKTKAGIRKIPMPSKLVDALSEYLHKYIEERPDVYLFSGNGSSPWTKGTIWRHFEGIKKAAFGDDAPEDFSPHIFRHTYTHDLVTNGIPPITAQALLGHSSYAITLGVYAHYGWKDIDASQVVDIFNN